MKKTFLILSVIAFIVSGCGQKMTDEKIEAYLVKLYKSVQAAGDVSDWDKLDNANKAFKEKLLDYASNYPSTLTFNFDLLKKEIDVASSEDGFFRIYSWNNCGGGTMQEFENVFQFKSGDNVYTKASKVGDGIFNPFYSQIFTLKANGKTYYLAINNDILSSKDAMQSIKVFTIENNTLNDQVKLFKTKTQLLNEINVSFDFSSVEDRPERPMKLIKYDHAEKTVYIPIVYENGKVTDKYIVYQFNGQYFEHKNTKTPAYLSFLINDFQPYSDDMRSDNLLDITETCFIEVYSEEQTIEYSEAMDDWFLYIAETKEKFAKMGVKGVVGKQFLSFIIDNNEKIIVDTKDRDWGIILYKSGKKPLLVDNVPENWKAISEYLTE